MKPEDQDFAERFWRVVCGFEMILRLMFFVSTVFLVLIALTYVYFTVDEIGRVMLRINLLILAILVPSVLACLRHCHALEY